MRAVLLALTAALASPGPSYNVVIHATLDMNVHRSHGGSCFEDATRHVVITNAKPLTLTAAKLGRAQNFLFQLAATESRTDAYSGDCTGATVYPTTGCGTVSYRIGSAGTGVGFVGRTSSVFELFYTRISTDPYNGACAPSIWGVAPTPGSSGKVWVDDYPPSPSGGFGPTVARAKLAAGKPFTVNWSTSGGDAPDFYGDTDSWTVAWHVALTPA
jgi:hypothetical protein